MGNLTTDQIQQFINLLVILVGAVVALGTLGLSASILVIRQNKELAIMAYNSIPLPERQNIRTGVVIAKQALDLADEITDPAAAPTQVTLHPDSVAAIGATVAKAVSEGQAVG